LSKVTTSIWTSIPPKTSMYVHDRHHIKVSNNNSWCVLCKHSHMQLRSQFVQVSKHSREEPIKFNNLLILSYQMISRPCRGSYDWVRQTPQSFKITILDIIFLKSSMWPYWNFSLSARYKLNFISLSTRQHECALLAQEAHTFPKSHNELNIWQRILLLQLRLLKSRIIHHVAKQVSKEIKGLIQVVSKIYDEVVKFY
jgi:hypothetical protein